MQLNPDASKNLAVFLLFSLTLRVEVSYKLFETKNMFDSLLFIHMIT